MTWTRHSRTEELKGLDKEVLEVHHLSFPSTNASKERLDSKSWNCFTAANRTATRLKKACTTRKQEKNEGLGLCQDCQKINLQRIFEPAKGCIKAGSWRTLNLLAYLDFHTLRPCWEPKQTWRVSMKNRDTCRMCAFLAACSSRMGFPVEEFSSNGYIEPGIRRMTGITNFASGDPSTDPGFFDVNVLELRVCPDGHQRSPWISKLHRTWSETHYILPLQNHGEERGPSDTVDYEVIKEWLNFCETEHSTCINTPSYPLSDTIPGLCLIDCHTKKIVPAAGLGKPQYVTLSYVWGTSGAASIPPLTLPEGDRLPKIVCDAMLVTLNLGYTYLWVDRYCIPQDDPYAKHIQIQNMGSIYSLSVLTIIGAAGEDAEYGLPGVSSPPSVPQLWTTIPCGSGKNFKSLPLIYFNPPDTEIRNAKWFSRGWTYQEGLLAKRRLVFSDRHVYFQCQEMHTTGELNFDGRKWGYQKPRRKREHLTRRYEVGKAIDQKEAVFPYPVVWDWESSVWQRVDGFMNRTLSYDMDGLDAMKGIIQTFREQSPLRFVWGLPYRGLEYPRVPESHREFEYRPCPPGDRDVFFEVDTHPKISVCELLGSLFWKGEWMAKPDNNAVGDGSKIPSPRREVLPSWTWAGWKSLPTHDVRVSPGRFMADQCFRTSQTPVSIKLAFKDKTLDWIEDHHEILKRSEIIGKFPDYLSITSSVFDAELVCTKVQDRNTISLAWKYVSPPFLVGKTQQDLPPGLFEEVEGNRISLLGLYFYSWGFPRSSNYLDFDFLLLRESGQDESGPLYERVTSVFVTELSFYHEQRKELPAGCWPPVLDKEVREQAPSTMYSVEKRDGIIIETAARPSSKISEFFGDTTLINESTKTSPELRKILSKRRRPHHHGHVSAVGPFTPPRSAIGAGVGGGGGKLGYRERSEPWFPYQHQHQRREDLRRARSPSEALVDGCGLSWFTWPTSLGLLSLVLYLLPEQYHFRGITTLITTLFIADLVLFILFSLLMVYCSFVHSRYCGRPRQLCHELTSSATKLGVLAYWPVAWLTLVGFAVFLATYDDETKSEREQGDGAADADGGDVELRRRVLATIAYVMWWVGVAWMTGTIVFVMGVLTGAMGGASERWLLRKGAGGRLGGEEEDDEVRMALPGCLLSSAFGMGFLALVGGLMVSVLLRLGTMSLGMAATVLVLSFCLEGVAVFTTLFLYAVLQQEMIQVERRASAHLVKLSWWMMGSASVCAAAVQILGRAAVDVSAILGDGGAQGARSGTLFTPATAQAAHMVCILLALLLIGLAALWMIFSLMAFASYAIRRRLTWKGQWDDAVIPVAAFALSTVQFRTELDSSFFGIVTCILVVIAAASLVLSLVLCIRQVVSASFLAAVDQELRV
ncbi:voltage-dependent anion channel-domain-containing protein [Sordaria brevicollis]|uniref:Voltage-dependent anion channel-domain-containing protein n=1 Tax=Sordaria brevicollis TaxID=83679 RepID=A0AAE0NVF7_SORBR|nr:voltage-dependent anion channel-domain-containing protein [Sordaria brevicollis]